MSQLNKKWLLYFDNASPVGTVLRMISQLQKLGGEILISSRRKDWKNIFTIEILEFSEELLSPANAAKLGIDTLDDESRKELSVVLGHLPLALNQAGMHIQQWKKENGGKVESIEWREWFNREDFEIVWRVDMLFYPKTVYVAFTEAINAAFEETSCDYINAKNVEIARETLNLCAFFNEGESIPAQWIKDWLREEKKVKSELRIKGILNFLNNNSLIRLNKVGVNNEITMHCVMQRVIKENLDKEENIRYNTKASDLIRNKEEDFRTAIKTAFLKITNKKDVSIAKEILNLCAFFEKRKNISAELIKDWLIQNKQVRDAFEIDSILNFLNDQSLIYWNKESVNNEITMHCVMQRVIKQSLKKKENLRCEREVIDLIKKKEDNRVNRMTKSQKAEPIFIEQLFYRYLHKKGLEIRECDPDGNCGFHAVAFQLGSEWTQEKVREKIADHVENNKEHYKNKSFSPTDDYLKNKNYQNIHVFGKDIINGRYLIDPEDTQLVANTFSRPVLVYEIYGEILEGVNPRKTEPERQFSRDSTFTEPIRLVFTKTRDGEGHESDHWDALVEEDITFSEIE